MVKGEAGEAMTVNDNEESWMFHIIGDDTGKSAVWVAQRVPPGHISVCANAFVIKGVDLDNTENFMGSDNIFDVAERSGIWDKEGGQVFAFNEIYGQDRGHLSTYVNRRAWRILSWAAPSLNLDPHTDIWSRDYPFSVKVETPLTVADVEAMQRDHFEGTEFDTTKVSEWNISKKHSN